MENLGSNLKILRHKKSLSQEELAKQASIKLSNLAKLEGGFNLNPTLNTLTALAKVLTKGSIDKLIGFKAPKDIKNVGAKMWT